MDKLAAIEAVFVTCRQVRDEVHFIFAVASEKGTDCLDRIGGFPKPGESRWCVIARLNSGASGVAAPDGGEASINPPEPQDASASGASRPPTYLAQQAARLCTKPSFRLYLEGRFPQALPTGCGVNTEDDAADLVRWHCGVDSRREIVPGTPEGDNWEKLHADYLAWERCL
jgi:hypothetical protein